MCKKYFTLNENAELILGKSGGTVLDFTNRKVYAVDKLSMQILDMLIGGMEIEKALNSLSGDDRKLFYMYLCNIEKLGLGNFSNEFIEKAKVVKSVKRDIDTVWLELRKSCNLKCCHCYMDCDSKSDSGLNLLKLDEWKSVIDSLKGHNIRKIILIGGEPLLFEGLEELIDYIRKRMTKAAIVLYSNLTVLRDSQLDCIVRNDVKAVTSIYSHIESVHDKITGRRGSWYKTVQGIKMIRKNGGTVRANIVIMNYNYEEIDKTKAFVKEITGYDGKTDVIRNVGKNKSSLCPKEYVVKKDNPVRFNGVSKKQFIRNISGNSCWQGKINITCDGYVSPCIMGEKFVDKRFNIRSNSLDDIIKGYLIPEFWSLSRDKIEPCRECEYRYVCSDCRPLCGKKENILKKEKKCSIY